jgi:hypothetical protein
VKEPRSTDGFAEQEHMDVVIKKKDVELVGEFLQVLLSTQTCQKRRISVKKNDANRASVGYHKKPRNGCDFY